MTDSIPDIVYRLRKAKCTPKNQDGCIRHEAAKEIERLRRENNDLMDVVDDYTPLIERLAEAERLLQMWRGKYQEGYWGGISPEEVDVTDAFLAAAEVDE